MRAVDNQNINITCRVLGAPKPIIKWIRNGKELTGGRYTTHENGNLQISILQFDDRGDYMCFAENKFGNASASAKLDIKGNKFIVNV